MSTLPQLDLDQLFRPGTAGREIAERLTGTVDFMTRSQLVGEKGTALSVVNHVVDTLTEAGFRIERGKVGREAAFRPDHNPPPALIPDGDPSGVVIRTYDETAGMWPVAGTVGREHPDGGIMVKDLEIPGRFPGVWAGRMVGQPSSLRSVVGALAFGEAKLKAVHLLSSGTWAFEISTNMGQGMIVGISPAPAV
ncbi:hypothetical protein GCM10009760_26240 [Kitasatospora kazusensis]|uniref:Uncharacterized protein n=1 Tax=Kitasatospora kazusensis TaxID=407974 RepID=A0ABP5L4V9_9ACTN